MSAPMLVDPDILYDVDSRPRRRRRTRRADARDARIHRLEHELGIVVSERRPGCGPCMGPPMRVPSGAVLPLPSVAPDTVPR